jgi:hypothetical protein
MRDSMIIYRSFFEAIKELPKDVQSDVWNAVFEYGMNFTEVELSGLSKSIFTLIKPNLQANIEKFNNGKKAKQKQTISKPEAKDKQTRSKRQANANVDKDVNVDVNVNVNVDDNVNVKPSDKSDHLTSDFLEVYNKFLESKTGATEQFSIAGRAGLKKIITYLKVQVEKKFTGPQTSPQDSADFRTEIVNAWRWVLSNYTAWDKFHQGQIKLEQINSNLINIINSIKNGHTKSGNSNQRNAEQLAAEAIAISRARANDAANIPTQEV